MLINEFSVFSVFEEYRLNSILYTTSLGNSLDYIVSDYFMVTICQ